MMRGSNLLLSAACDAAALGVQRTGLRSLSDPATALPPAHSAAESTGGGDKGNHGRRRRAMGHLRALLLRGQANTAEVRALHGMVKELESRLRQAQ